MKVLLAVAIAACALRGPSMAEEMTLVEAKGARAAVVGESIRFRTEGHYVSADMVLTHASDGTSHPISMVSVCRRNDGEARGIGLVSYQNDGMVDANPGTADGSKAFDSIARAKCGRVGLRAWASAQP